MKIIFKIIIPTLVMFLSCCGNTDVLPVKSVKPIKYKGPPLPVFYISKVEIDYLNSLECVYIYPVTNKTTIYIEFNMVFTDEDRPDAFQDWVYDTMRLVKYNTKRVIKTLYIYYNRNNELIKIYLSNCYSSTNEFYNPESRPKDLTVKAKALGFIEKRPKIYINTWEHLMSERDNNKTMQKVLIDNYTLYYGERATSEKTNNI